MRLLKLLLWIVLSSAVISAAPRLMHSAAELYKLRFATKPPLLLHNHPDLIRRPKYMHRGSRRNIRTTTSTNPDCSGQIRCNTFWRFLIFILIILLALSIMILNWFWTVLTLCSM
ncbi:hypothetical protein Q8A67_022860 [Cirrhinus molitorella]|uniref:Uncharacterized protein n=1 Tax=Cirrhinus molitorella TaxID=172907 RepID=A0AA88PGF6_9TELE|nr:hypothetical protein Q8A67_022860 [Cirrhinus molitorella]